MAITSRKLLAPLITACSDDSLPLEVLVRLPIVHIALRVLELLVHIGPEAPRGLVLHGAPQPEGVLNGSDLKERLGVGDTQGSHAGLVLGLLEVLLKGSTARVRVVTADLACELALQSVQLPQPVGDGLAVGTQGQLEGVVNVLIALLL